MASIDAVPNRNVLSIIRNPPNNRRAPLLPPEGEVMMLHCLKERPFQTLLLHIVQDDGDLAGVITSSLPDEGQGAVVMPASANKNIFTAPTQKLILH